MSFVLIVQYGCNSSHHCKNVCYPFSDPETALRFYGRFARRALEGQWYERLELIAVPGKVQVIDAQLGTYKIV